MHETKTQAQQNKEQLERQNAEALARKGNAGKAAGALN